MTDILRIENLSAGYGPLSVLHAARVRSRGRTGDASESGFMAPRGSTREITVRANRYVDRAISAFVRAGPRAEPPRCAGRRHRSW